MNLIDRLLNRRAPTSTLSLADDSKKGKEPNADPIERLTAHDIEHVIRRDMNKGLFARPAWTFHELAKIVSILGDKVRFWKAQVSACEWKIKIAEDASDDNPEADALRVERARRSEAVLREHYESIRNLKQAIKHLATARFYGFAVLRRSGNFLQIVHPWNVIHDTDWGMGTPSFNWFFNPTAATNLDKMRVEQMKPVDYIIRDFDDGCLIELCRLAFRAKSIMDFREKNLEEASKNQIIILTGAGLPAEGAERQALESALLQARRGESAVIAKGDPTCPTEVHKPDAAQGLPYYNETLANVDEMMTKAVTGGMLTMLSMPTGIGSGASEQHQESLNAILADDLGEISELFQEYIDLPILRAAGLLDENTRPLAWFELSLHKEADPQQAAELLGKIKQAGYSVGEAEAGEMLGLSVTKDTAPVSSLFNRATTGGGFFKMLDRIARDFGGDGEPDENFFAAIESIVANASPAVLADSEAFEALLRERLAEAQKRGTLDGLKNA